MKKLVVAIILVVCIPVLSVGWWSDNNWEFLKEIEQMRIYSRHVEGSDFKAYKAIIDVDVPFEIAVEIAKDHDHYRDWYGMCKDIFVIDKRSNHDYDMYFVLDMPGGASDRDLVVRITTEWDYIKGQCQADIKSKESTYKSDSGLVRMPKMEGQFTITRINANKIRVVYQFFAETGGFMPAWIVNQGAWRHAYETMLGVLKEVSKAK